MTDAADQSVKLDELERDALLNRHAQRVTRIPDCGHCEEYPVQVVNGAISVLRSMREGECQVIEFDVYGMPGPQGSKRFMGTSKKTGRGIMIESSAKVKPWREAVKCAARIAMTDAGLSMIDAPIRVEMIFTLPKPSSAPKTRQTFPMRKPDGSKLQRSTEDALSDAGLWRDDARVVEWIGAKRYPNEGRDALDSPGVRIRVEVIGVGQ